MTETKQAAGGRTVHLALVQFESVLCDPAANTQKACRMIAEAAAEGADLVVLPELFSTGYELNIVGPHVPELAEPVDGPTVRALQDAARAGNCYVVAGLALAYDMAGVPFNSSVVIDRQGELLARTTSSICGRSSASTSAPAATARCSTPTSGASA